MDVCLFDTVHHMHVLNQQNRGAELLMYNS